MKKNTKGFSVVEVLIASGLFAFVVLGIAQAVMVMHRYSRANICKMQAHITAMSYFEQILGDIHPLQLFMANPTPTGSTLKLIPLSNPEATEAQKINLNYNLTAGFDTANPVFASVYAPNDMRIEFNLQVRGSPLYENYNLAQRNSINPPIGFQSIYLIYRWQSSTATDPNNTATWPTNQLYAIRPISPDDPS